MIRVDVQKEELEKFFETLKEIYKKNGSSLSFIKFKNLFCNEELFINKIGTINNYITKNNKTKGVNNIKKIYKKISSDNGPFYTNIREFIILRFVDKVSFCPYCGKTPLIFYEKGKDKKNSFHRMFQFDHFFPKNSFHEGIINFYNLIPSCNACNHLKGTDNPLKKINRGGVVFHPYFGNLFLDNGVLKKDYSDNADIKLNFVSKNSKFYKLGKKYLNSEDTFNEFNFISDKRNKILAEKMLIKKYGKLMKGKKQCRSDEELKDYFFNGYYSKDEQDILTHSNGKLKKDIIGDLDLSI